MEWLVAYGGTRADMMVMDAKGNYCLDDYTQLNGCAGRLGPDAPDGPLLTAVTTVSNLSTYTDVLCSRL
jgi:hypothetical protein